MKSGIFFFFVCEIRDKNLIISLFPICSKERQRQKKRFISIDVDEKMKVVNDFRCDNIELFDYCWLVVDDSMLLNNIFSR